MRTEQDIEKFYKDFEGMKLLKPVAVMVEASGLSSGNVSEYLSRKKKPSAKFIDAFYEKVYKNSINVPQDTVSDRNVNQGPVNKDLAALIESNLTMSRSIEKNSNSLADLVSMLKEKSTPVNSDVSKLEQTQLEILALLKAAIRHDLDYKAKGDQRKADEIAQEINKSAADEIRIKQQSGKHAHGKTGK